MIRAMEPRIRTVVTEVLDKVASQSSCDFVEDITVSVPLAVIAELMELPVEDRNRFWHWSDALMAGEGRTDPDGPTLVLATTAFGEYMDYVSSLITDCRSAHRAAKAAGEPAPHGGLIAVLVAAAEEGIVEADELRSKDTLAADELMMVVVGVIVAGNETTRNAISGGMWAFEQFPDQWQWLVADSSLWDTATDEIIRFVSPVMSFLRAATQDTELAGQTIKEGERVLMIYQSANRDDAIFDHPDELIIDRDPNPHIGFGVGPHVCMGINLAHLEVRVLFKELAKRLPDIHVKSGHRAVCGDSTLVHANESLPVEFTTEESHSKPRFNAGPMGPPGLSSTLNS